MEVAHEGTETVFDAATADRVLAEYKSLFEEASLKDLLVSATLEEEESGSNESRMLLKHAQDRVRKLKSNFLELETKARFLEVILNAKDMDSINVSDEMLAETEISVAHAKNKLKKLKERDAEDRSELESTIQGLASRFEEYEAMHKVTGAKLNALVASVEDKKAQMAVEDFLTSGDDARIAMCFENIDQAGKEGVQTLLDAEVRQQEMLSKRIVAAEKEIAQLEVVKTSAQEQVTVLGGEVKQLESRVQNKEEEDSRRAQLRELSNSYVKSTSTLANLTGVKVVDASPRQVRLNVTLVDKRAFDLCLLLDRYGSGVTSAEISPGSIQIEGKQLENRSTQEVVARIIDLLESQDPVSSK
ncbi:hypothetical protein NDN08_004724 [Rhodosorus marinus]|uniref:Kinetochore protein Sos7 coiled-coil domain-containing protein n=1 Tax=Rhodosorus marinus TaxID=101924 RepID=A0AAV8UR87_9RHOD|nr:hypothetical protein NDN08_004724 [Rhodosorus marinus]